ncbi:truncated cAMP-dependent protein kinase [Aminobacter sp. Y103A]|nr:truncated cAMP-dependent protein kinase [Aminobacter sp. SS-2016]
MLGELALIADTRRLTSAAAAIDSEIIRLNRKMFHRILEEYPELAERLHQHILEDLQDMIARIESMAPRFGK